MTAYNYGGKLAGIYTRLDTESAVWIKQDRRNVRTTTA
jgi:hypothetical protein